MRSIGAQNNVYSQKVINECVVFRCYGRKPTIRNCDVKGVVETIMVSPFEDFINGMTESQYEYWLANESTEKQYDSAIHIREELEESETIQGEQGNTPEARQNRFLSFIRGLFNR